MFVPDGQDREDSLARLRGAVSIAKASVMDYDAEVLRAEAEISAAERAIEMAVKSKAEKLDLLERVRAELRNKVQDFAFLRI